MFLLGIKLGMHIQYCTLIGVLLQYVYSSVPLHWEFGCAISEGQMSERRAISWGGVAILPSPAWHVGLFCSKLEF